MSQQFNPSRGRRLARRLSGYLKVLATLLLTLVAPNAHAQTACKVTYTISPQNTSAFGAALTIQNTGTAAWTSWTLTWAFANGQTVSQLWNGIETQSGANVTVKNESYNGSVAAGGTVTGIGFNGTWNGATNAVPAAFSVNGVTCGATLPATTTALAASTTTPTVGASVTLTATVAPAAATGTVTFYSGTTSLGTGTLSVGKAMLATSFATAGTYSLTAVYAGSTAYATSTSSAVTVTVSTATKTATTTTLAASTTTPVAGASVTLTATVAPAAATGTVTFYSGTTSLGTGTLSAGVATLATSFATAGTYALTAVYAGSTAYATSTSSAVSIDVSPATGTGFACNVVYTITPQSSAAFGATVVLNNTGTTAWTSWTLQWIFANGQTISSLWNGVETQSGALVTVTNVSYNGSVAAGGSVTNLGFNGNTVGGNAIPTAFAVNGNLCAPLSGDPPLAPTGLTASIGQSADHAFMDSEFDCDELSSEEVDDERRSVHYGRYFGHNQLHRHRPDQRHSLLLCGRGSEHSRCWRQFYAGLR